MEHFDTDPLISFFAPKWNKRLFHYIRWSSALSLYAYAIRWPDILLPLSGFLGSQLATLMVARSSVQPHPFVQDNRLV
jgi:hypothetical protein